MTDDQLLCNPIIVIGAPRSGTTILGQMLEKHSTLCGLEEPRLTWQYGNDRKSDMLRPADARPEVVRYIRKQFAQQVRASGCTRLLEKTPSNALRLGFVETVLPECKFIHITRNGFDSTLSIREYWNQAAHGIRGVNPGKISARLKELQFSRMPYYAAEAMRRFAPKPFSRFVGPNVWGPRIPGIRGLLAELHQLEVCALQWRTCVESARYFGLSMSSDRYVEVKLEELDLAAFRRILAFADLEEESPVLENFENVMDPKLSKARRSSASEQDVQTLAPWITSTMQWLGYA